MKINKREMLWRIIDLETVSASYEDIIDALKQACAYEFIEPLPKGIHSKIGENGGGFSVGQIQRLAIARALVSQAPIILLDEATSSLDTDTERKILHNVLEKNRHRTLIFVTHKRSILPMCDRIYKISKKVLQNVTADEISVTPMEHGNESKN